MSNPFAGQSVTTLLRAALAMCNETPNQRMTFPAADGSPIEATTYNLASALEHMIRTGQPLPAAEPQAPAAPDFTRDPEHGGALHPGEAFARGNGGSIVFDVATGEITRRFPSDEVPEHHDGYGDIVRVDVADLRGAFGDMDGEGFDVLDCTMITDKGETVPHERDRHEEEEEA